MRKFKIILIFMVAALIPFATIYVCFAWPSDNFHEEEEDIFDDWHVCRTSGLGEDGFMGIEVTETEVWFRPLIAFESLGEYADIALSMGEQFVDEYPDLHQRAEKVFEYVRDQVQYLNDIDQFDTEEYALNADEIANTIQEDGIAYGDCEEFAVLLAVMYQGAGIRSAIVICPGHAAALVYLPEYEKTNAPFFLEGEPGWVWAEATGNNNPFGWCPVGEIDEPILGYEISADEHIPLWQPPEEELPPETTDEEELLPKPDEEELPLIPGEEETPPKPDEEELPLIPGEEETPPEPGRRDGQSAALRTIIPIAIFLPILIVSIIFIRRRIRRARSR